jgi:hypothetical protein
MTDVCAAELVFSPELIASAGRPCWARAWLIRLSTAAAAALDAPPAGWLALADAVGVGFAGGAAECVGGGTEAAIEVGGAGWLDAAPLGFMVGDPGTAGSLVIGPVAAGPGVRGGCEWQRPAFAAHGRDEASCSVREDWSWTRMSP